LAILIILLILVCIFLSALVLLQPGSGEGLAGALGGYGSLSPFGTKTAQKITRLTMYIGALLFALVVAIEVMQRKGVFVPRTLPVAEEKALPAAGEKESEPQGKPQEPPGTLPEKGGEPSQR